MSDLNVIEIMLRKANKDISISDITEEFTVRFEHVIGTVRETGEKVEIEMPITDKRKIGNQITSGNVYFYFDNEGNLNGLEGESYEY